MAHNRYVKQYRILCLIILIGHQPQFSKQEDNTIKDMIEETKEEVKHLIHEGEDMYLRAMSVILDAGARYFCWSLELEPEHSFTINYKVDIYIPLHFVVPQYL